MWQLFENLFLNFKLRFAMAHLWEVWKWALPSYIYVFNGQAIEKTNLAFDQVLNVIPLVP